MSRSTTLTAYSFSHRNTSLEDRDRLAFSADAARAFIALLHEQLGVEAAVISTCNRTEFYLFGPAQHVGWAPVRRLLAEFKQLDEASIPAPDQAAERHAARHLFRVATSLESLALGENQILSQVKDAHDLVLEQAFKAPAIDRLFQFAVRCGKQVRTETELCQGTVSISSVAVELATKIFGDFDGRQIVIVGAGETAEKASTHFVAAGNARFTVLNRSESRGRALADQLGGEFRPLDDLEGALTDADVVLVATGAQNYLLTAGLMKRVTKARGHRPLFLIDISNPRNIDPKAGRYEGVFLYNMDDLQQVVARHLDKRREEIPAAMAVVDHYVDEWDAWVQSLQVTPTIASLAKFFEAVRAQELERHKNRVAPDEQQLLDEFSKGLVKKLLHNPIMYLRAAVENNTLSSDDLNLVWALYNLEDGDSEET